VTKLKVCGSDWSARDFRAFDKRVVTRSKRLASGSSGNGGGPRAVLERPSGRVSRWEVVSLHYLVRKQLRSIAIN
jgi:hypothetical protein